MEIVKYEIFTRSYDPDSAEEVSKAVYELVQDLDKEIDTLEKENRKLRLEAGYTERDRGPECSCSQWYKKGVDLEGLNMYCPEHGR